MDNSSRERQCPRCQTPDLREFQHGGLTLDTCSRCAGLWVDGDELAPLSNSFRDGDDFLEHFDRTRWGAKDHSLAGGVCPRDGERMQEYRLPCAQPIDPVTLDVCPRCIGVWIDGPEVEPLRQATLINLAAKFPVHIEVGSPTPWRDRFVAWFVPRFAQAQVRRWLAMRPQPGVRA